MVISSKYIFKYLIFCSLLMPLYVRPNIPFQKAAIPIGNANNQDAYEAIPICTNTYHETATSTGRGKIQELRNTCLFLGERRSRWYVFTVQRNGNLAFTIDTWFNLDWALYDVSASGSYAVRESSPVRCNYSGDAGPTGMKGNSTGNSQSFMGSPWSNELSVTAGQTFLLIIDNPLEVSSAYDINFTGTTTLIDNSSPAIKNIQYNCTEEAVTVTFTEPIRCSSIRSSDFSIIGAKVVTVVDAQGINCMASTDLTRSVKVSFSGNMSTGAYTLHLKAGSVEDNCGLLNATGIMAFDYLGTVGINALNDTLCENENLIKATLTGTGGGSYIWSPNVALSDTTGSSVEAQPTQTTSYWVTVKYGNCERKVSKVVRVNSAPVVTIKPKNSILCSGSSVNLQGVATLDGLNCPNCKYTWSTGSTTTAISAGVGTYTLTAISANKCKATAVATVQSAIVPSENTCNIIYASPNGMGTGLKANSPTTLQKAVLMGACNNVVIFLQKGTYNLNEKLYLGSYITLEGGFNEDYTQKTSQAGVSTLYRLGGNIEGLPDAPRLVAIEAVGERFFRLQDITVRTVAAPMASAASNWKGVSTYAVYLNGCSQYEIVRCQLWAGRASDGLAGKGSNNTIGFDGGNGIEGAGGGHGGTALFGYNAGGLGGNGGVGGKGALLSGGGTAPAGGNGGKGGQGRDNSSTLPGFSGLNGQGVDAGSGGLSNMGASGGFSCQKMGTDGTDAFKAGANGNNGNNGIITYNAGYFTPADGAHGTPGISGAGGGGGSGAPQNNFIFKYGGGGGVGGSGGGGGGGGGFGGTGGGASYALFLFNNGDKGNVQDCDLTVGVAGKGALGGSGGLGGRGAAAHISLQPCAGFFQYYFGGYGGRGTNGGSGGSGGRGANGEAVSLKLIGGKPLTTQTALNLRSQAWILAGSGASYLGYATSTKVLMRMNATMGYANLGLSSNPSSSASKVISVEYSQIGRKDIILEGLYEPSKKYIGFNNIVVNKPPTDTIRGRKIVCSGTYDYLSSLSEMLGMNFVWSVVNPPGGVSSIAEPTASQAIINFTNNTSADIVFTVTVDLISNCCGPVGTESMQVLVRPSLKITKLPVNTSVCEGDNAIFDLEVVANNLQYEWSKNGVPLQNGAIYQGVYSPKLKILAADKTMDNGVFSCKMTHDCGTSERSATLKVKPIPTAIILANPLNLCSGESSHIQITSVPNGSRVTYSVNSQGEVSVTAPYNFDAVIKGATAFNKVSVSYDGCVNDTANDSFRVLVSNDTNLVFAGNDRQICFDTLSLAALPVLSPNTGEWKIVSGAGGSVSDVNDPSALFKGIKGNTYILAWTMFSPTCSDRRSDTVKIQLYPQTQLTKDVSSNLSNICDKGSATLSVQANTLCTYQWRSPASMQTPVNEMTSALASTALTPEITRSTYFHLKVTDQNSCLLEDSILVSVYPKPIATIEGPDGLCSGESTTLTATGGISCEWFQGMSSNSKTINISPVATTLYKVAIKDAQGCKDTAELNVRVEAELVATISGKLHICLGDTTTLTAGGATAFEWIAGVGGIQRIQKVAPLVTTTYTVRATNGSCSDDTSVTIFVHTPPLISIRTDTVLCRGDSLKVQVTGGINCLWNDGFVGFSRNLKPSTGTNYTAIIEDANQCTDTASVYIKVLALPFANISGQSTICQGEKTTLQGSGGIEYKWNTALGATTPSISVNPTTTTTYKLIVTDTNNCSKDTSFILRVNPSPSPRIRGLSTICLGDSTTLEASDAIFYEWGTGEVANEIEIKPSTTTTYTLKGTDMRGCSASIQHIVQVSPLPTLSLRQKDTICFGGEIWVNCSGDAHKYIWDDGYSGTQKILSPKITTTYSVIASFNTGCSITKSIEIAVRPLPQVKISGTNTLCFDDTTTLSASGAASYLWSTGEIGANIKIKGSSTLRYWVKGTDVNGCVAFDTIHLNILDLPQPTLIANNVICAGASTSISAKGGISYLWNTGETTANISVSPLTTTTYSVLAMASNGCVKEGSLQIVVNQLPVVSIDATKLSICQGNTSTLIASGALNYLWNDSTTHYSKTVQAMQTTQYTVIGTDVNGCKAIGNIQLEVYPLPIIEIEGVDALCEGEETTLTANGGTAYVWNNGKTTTSITEKPLADTTYLVRVTDIHGCVNVDSIAVTVRPVLNAYMEGNLEICQGESTVIKGNGGAYFSWTGGGITSSSRYLILSPTDTTTYTLTVSSPNLCTDDTTFTVIVKPFTPIQLSTVDTTICQESPIDFYALGALEYRWNTGAITDTLKVQASTTTQYNLSVLDQNRCTQNFSFKANVNPNPIAILNAPDALCIGTELSLSASGGITYLWNTTAITSSILIQPDKDTNVSVIVFSDKGCSDTAFKHIQVVNKIEATISGNLTICRGEATLITAGGGSEYEWLVGISGTDKTVSLNPEETTTYKVKVSTALCKDDTTFQITVNEPPFASVTPDTNICLGERLFLKAEGGGTYLWSTGETTQSIILTPSLSRDYSVLVTDSNNCKDYAYTTILVDQLPTPKITGANIICLYDTTVLKGLNAHTYYWSTGAHTQSISVSPPSTTTYTLTGALANGCKNTASAVVTVNPQPLVSVSGKDTVCAGLPTTLTAKGAVNFNWSTGSTNFMITPAPLLPTTYWVIGKDAKGCADTVPYKVNVNPLPIIKILGIDGLCTGESTVLTATGANTYLWNTGATLDNIKVSPVVNTIYSVTGTDGNLCVGNKSMEVTVSKPIFATISGVLTICEGDSTLLTAGGGSAYLWTQGLSGTERSQWAKPTMSTDYTVVVTTQSGCTDTRTVRVIVNPLPTVSLNRDTTICEGENIHLRASGAASYLWSTGQTTASISVNPDTTTTYMVKITDVNGCSAQKNTKIEVNAKPHALIIAPPALCMGEDTVIHAQGGSLYLWNTGQTTSSIHIHPLKDTTFWVIVKSNLSCSDTTYFSMAVRRPIVATISGKTDICFGDSTLLIGSGGNEFLWTGGGISSSANTIVLSPATSTEYRMETNTRTCYDDTVFTINVYGLPSIDFSNDTSVCEGSNLKLFASGGTSYLWSTGDATSSIEFMPIETTTYKVSVIDANLCNSTAEIEVEVMPIPHPYITGTDIICEGDTLRLKANNGYSYTWNTMERDVEIRVTPKVNTTYTVEAQLSNGCTNTASIDITVNPSPVLILRGANTACIGARLLLKVSGALTYLWNTGISADSLWVKVDADSTYTVRASDFNQCTASIEHKIKVNPLPIVQIAGVDGLCTGETTILTATGGISYLWNNGKTTPSITERPLVPTRFSVWATDANTCKDSAFVDITVALPIVASFSGKTDICQGDSTLLIAVGGAVFEWTDEYNQVRTGKTLWFKPAQTTQYTLTASTPTGCFDDTVFSIVVRSRPVLNTSQDTTVCQGQNVRLFVSGSGGNYIWSTGETGTSIEVQAIRDTSYTVRLEDANTCVSEAVIRLHVNPKPLAFIVAPDALCTGEGTTLYGSGGINYLWNTGEISSKIDIKAMVDTTFWLLVSSDKGCKSDTAKAFIQVGKPLVASFTGNTDICSEDTASLTAWGGADYLWTSSNGFSQSGKNIKLSPSIDTYYTLEARTATCWDDTSFWVYVRPLPSFIVTPDTSICKNDTAILSANGADIYLWSTGETSSSIRVSPKTTLQYSVLATENTHNCSNLAQVEVEVLARPNLYLFGDTLVCKYDSASLHARNAHTYWWSNGDMTPDIRVAPLQYTVYSVWAVLSNNCDATDSIGVKVLPSYQIHLHDTIYSDEQYWFNNQNLSQAGTYYDSLQTQAGCDSVYILHLEVLTSPYVLFVFEQNSYGVLESIHADTLTSDTLRILIGDSVYLSAIPNRYYQLDALLANGNEISQGHFIARVHTTFTPVFSIIPPKGFIYSDTSVCQMETVQIQFAFSGMPPYTYKITDDVNYRYSADSIFAIDFVAQQSHIYFLTALRNGLGTSALPSDLQGEASIQVNEMPAFTAEDIETSCQETLSYIKLPFTVLSGQPNEYQLLFDDKAIAAGLKNHTWSILPYREIQINLPQELPPDVYYLYVQMRNVNGCISIIDTVRLNVNYPPSVIRQKWNDVLLVQNEAYNGGYHFVTCQWYKNDIALNEYKMYLYETPALERGAEYKAKLQRVDGVILFTCPVKAKPLVAEIQVYPNMVKKGGEVNILVELGLETSNSSIHARLSHVQGKKIVEKILKVGENRITMPQNTGYYILEVVIDAENVKVFKIGVM